MATTNSLEKQRFFLSLVGVRIDLLDRDKREVSSASGFLLRDGQKTYLHSCWHVFTGLDPHHLTLGLELPRRRYARVWVQGADERQPGVEVIGGSQFIDIPLYEDPGAVHGPLSPSWEQCAPHYPNEFLNSVGIYHPAFTEAARLEVPSGGLNLSSAQFVDEHFTVLPRDAYLPSPGDKCLIVGFPYGFSSAGADQPTAVALTRFVAGTPISGHRRGEVLLDGCGAPSMSGGPVLIERTNQLFLLGVYTGSIFPDHALHTTEKTTAIGTVSDLRMPLWGSMPFTRRPNSPIGGPSKA